MIFQCNIYVATNTHNVKNRKHACNVVFKRCTFTSSRNGYTPCIINELCVFYYLYFFKK